MTDQQPHPRVPTTAVVIACTVLGLAALAVYVVLALSGTVKSDPTALVFLVLAAVLPSLGGQLATNAKLSKVDQQTNGGLSRLLDIVERQGRVIEQANPVRLPDDWSHPPAAPPATPPGVYPEGEASPER